MRLRVKSPFFLILALIVLAVAGAISGYQARHQTSPSLRLIGTLMVLIAGGAGGALVLYDLIGSAKLTTEQIAARVQSAELKAEQEPDKARPAWILAQTKLEAYFDRNLQQVNQVFFVAILVMFVGFAFIVTGVALSFHEGKISATEIVASGSGIITEFIGATFMVIYRSTMAQANEFMSVLERINTVGMAVQVLDSIPEAETKLKSETRARIIELLLLTNVRSKDSDKKKQAGNAKES
jgi:Cyanobacterial TRADD-N associated 2-Transmembrane domain